MEFKVAAAELGVGRETLRRAILAGELAATHDLGPGPPSRLVGKPAGGQGGLLCPQW